MTNNKLTQAEFYRLCEAIKEYSTQNRAVQASWEPVCNALAKSVGRRVTSANVKTACEAVGVDSEILVKSLRPKGGWLAMNTRMDDLESRIAKLENEKFRK